MAIELKELVIKASVDNNSTSGSQNMNDEDKAQLLKQCVEQSVEQSVAQVLRIIERQRGR